ncbi:MAG: molybdopterin-binding protein [Moraxellaceae bacterium]|uniref:molybdopterin-binding protein n=1 Tax=Phenylobacterium sp. TaxID=1871053 RepID=UPI0027168B66|nr:molybdopterin-binding protein [Phenylobacterium sp.]MDO8900222.1 molybdopterin-binding protein [Phenylobacterium sp.]MDP2225960.1 molybdopterin-binding protein [Moraxellaceae bacterium]
MTSIPRRGLLTGAGSALLSLTLAGCDQVSRNRGVRATLARAEGLTMAAQRLILSPAALAREFTPADISPDFRANGSLRPAGQAYQDLLANSFADWRLQVEGLVERPLSLSLDDLRSRPARTQITRHDCVEGWSSIGQWTGARLSALLEEAGLKPQARYIVFHCADRLDAFAAGDRGLYYESIDLVDAFHEQTILAYEMNGETLPVKHGAPLRLRVERQLGYKHAKYVMRIEAVESFAHIAGGQGGFWEDRGYEWYAGI